MDVPSSVPTIGQQLDAVIHKLDSLSSTQLYGVIVGAIVLITFFSLGFPHPPTPTSSSPSRFDPMPVVVKPRTVSGRQPRWHIFKYVNYAAVTLFGWSVADFMVHASTYLNDSDSTVLMQFLLGWSLLLCYFFGFFGVSIVHDLADPAAEESARSMKSPHKAPEEIAPVCSVPKVAAAAPPKKAEPSLPTDQALADLSNEAIADLVLHNKVKDHELEKRLDAHRAVDVRRIIFDQKLGSLDKAGALDKLPYQHALDYSQVHGANCEIVVGYVPIPVGIIGPLTINDESFYIPMATTEGCLVASANRGAKAITQGGGATACLLRDGITRAPCVRLPTARQAAELSVWTEQPENFKQLKAAFESTTSFGKLKSCTPTVAGRNVYLRLVCFSGDAMGMNMVSKGSLEVIKLLQSKFPEMVLVALSGNMCTDKKAAAMNWIEGRGKSVVVEAIIPKDIVKKTLKTTVDAIVFTNLHKNLIGSAMAGAIGGFNAHASNIVTAVFLATGQDPAQNVESSNCITLLEKTEAGDLWISCTMPSIEVGTVGGGTSLPAQAACLKVLGVKGGGATPGANARKLSTVVASATMAGELSLLAALASNTLVAAHMEHNRKK